MLGAITGDVVVADWLLHDAEHTYQGLEDHWFMYCGDKKQGLCRCRFGWTESEGQGKRVQCGAEYGRILQKYAALGVSGRVMWLATADAGMAFSIHPYLRVNTSFPHPLPRSLADSVESHSWTLFRHDFTDRTVGVFFYF